jgi:catechol 2,3-dioxygenase-like lactoylglutathione lyase family enzyme
VMPPTTEEWGQRTCYIADPEGNLIEIGSFTGE